jgi:hypothetical protein
MSVVLSSTIITFINNSLDLICSFRLTPKFLNWSGSDG